MTTQRSNEQIFARLFRMLDSPYEGEALSAFRQVRRILKEENATFGAILDHTEDLRATNMALGQQNQELHQENLKFRQRFDRFSLARAAATRVREFSARFTPQSVTVAHGISRSTSTGTRIPRDVGSLMGIVAVIAVVVLSCQQFVFNGANLPQSAMAAESPRLASLSTEMSVDSRAAAASQSRQVRWQASKLPADAPADSNIDHPAWRRLPTDFSVDHPPWCFACRGQPTHPRADQRRVYERVF
jgi:hypothetical protein